MPHSCTMSSSNWGNSVHTSDIGSCDPTPLVSAVGVAGSHPVGLLPFLAAVDDPGWDAALLAEGEQAAAVDEVEWLPASKLVTVRAVTGRGDHDSFGCALVLHCPPQVSYV